MDVVGDAVDAVHRFVVEAEGHAGWGHGAFEDDEAAAHHLRGAFEYGQVEHVEEGAAASAVVVRGRLARRVVG